MLQFDLRRLLSAGSLMVAMGIALVIDSRVSTRGVDPFLLVENPRAAFERYLGIAVLLIGFWLFRQSKSNAEDNREDSD